jgi:integrase
MLYISQTTAETLRKHLANRRRPDSPYLFAGRYGPLTARTLRYRLCMYGERCDVPVTPHRLRHTFGRPFGCLVNISLDMARYQERASSPWRFGVPSNSGLVSFQGT